MQKSVRLILIGRWSDSWNNCNKGRNAKDAALVAGVPFVSFLPPPPSPTPHTPLTPATQANHKCFDLHLLCRRWERCSKCIFSSQHCAKFTYRICSIALFLVASMSALFDNRCFFPFTSHSSSMSPMLECWQKVSYSTNRMVYWNPVYRNNTLLRMFTSVPFALAPPPLSPPPTGFPVYSLIRSPLTAAIYYLNAWNGLLVDRTTALVLVGLSARWESVDQELRALSTQLRSSVF